MSVEWEIETEGQFEHRQKVFLNLIEEKRKEIIKLNFEMASLIYLYNYFYNIGFKS